MHLQASYIIDEFGRRLGAWRCPLPDGAGSVPADRSSSGYFVLAAETTSPGPWTLLKIVLVGLFFNQVLPSGSRSHRIYSRVSGSVSTEEASPANSISFSLSWLAPEISNVMRC